MKFNLESNVPFLRYILVVNFTKLLKLCWLKIFLQLFDIKITLNIFNNKLTNLYNKITKRFVQLICDINTIYSFVKKKKNPVVFRLNGMPTLREQYSLS